jgi:hypothetical protein
MQKIRETMKTITSNPSHEGWFVWDEFYKDLDDMVEDYIHDLLAIS